MAENQISKEFWQEFDKTVSKTLVPRFSTDTIRPCAKEDFQDFTNTLKDDLHSVISQLDVIIQNEDQWTTRTKKNLVKVIIIVGEQHCKSVWNTNEIVELSKLLIPRICKIFVAENITQILKDDDIFLSAVMFLRPKLLKDTWKSFPAAVVSYKWLLELVEKPLLKRHVPEVLPTALIIFDDYVEENQSMGLECINLIIEHCHETRSLRNFNYDEVIFQALEKMAYKVEGNMIIPLYSCISNLLDNIQYCESSNNAFGWTKRDDILSILLDEMELQTNIQRRYAYVVSLSRLLIHSGTGKWSERLTRIFSEYCEDDTDLKTTNISLNLVKTFFSMYQPRGLNFYTSMYSSLLKLRYNLSTSEKDAKEIIENVDQCISLLTKLCPNLNKEIMANETIRATMNVS